jgi:mannose-6-phosphate isomerase
MGCYGQNSVFQFGRRRYTMNPWYPLRFQPLFRRYLWGGRRLHSVLGKALGEGDDYAESWEIVDHGSDQSVVANGHLAGRSLSQLIARHGPELLGRHHPQPRFPVLLKLLDCNRDLSVQVHPNDRQAAQLEPPDRGKTEAWVVLHADPGSRVYAGLKPGIDRQILAECVHTGRVPDCLHWFEPRVGDCIFIPARTVHALGAGLLIAEIQQASDTTFRLYDWDRVGPDAQPRSLHVQQALDVIDFEIGPIHVRQPSSTGRPGIERLVECEYFVMERYTFDTAQRMGDGDRFHLLAVLDGRFSVADHTFGPGDVTLLPAAADSLHCEPRDRAVVLDVFLP